MVQSVRKKNSAGPCLFEFLLLPARFFKRLRACSGREHWSRSFYPKPLNPSRPWPAASIL